MQTSVDKFLLDGCLRCKYGATPQCNVNSWRTELQLIRQIVLESELKEEVKWGVPCYTLNRKNVLMVSAFKDYACLSFFKGVLLKDEGRILQKQGENSQSSRIIPFTTPEQILEQAESIKLLISEAISIEKFGQKVIRPSNPEPLPEELTGFFREDPLFKQAFSALTPGRQRGYVIYFSQPKQSQSRINRIQKCRMKILNGEGLNDKYSC